MEISTSPNKFQSPSKDLLLQIPESGIKIYPHYMLIQSKYHRQQLKNNPISISNIETSEAAFQCNIEDFIKILQPTKNKNDDKICVNFNNSNFAFQADDSQKKIQIHNLSQKQKVKGNSLITQIYFTGIDSYMTVYALLRKKLCEMGFDNKYVLKESLGKGATAEVFLVERKHDNKKFAAKIISIKDSTAKAYETFINQSKLLRVLNHKNIVRLQSLYVHKKKLIQVMEYISGGHLLNALKKNQLKFKTEKWSVLHDLLEGLDHLRQKRIIHRDLKLENILIRQKNGKKQYVISDFGLAVWGGEPNPAFHKCGTPGYIAPQTLVDNEEGKIPFSHLSDIFSLGVIAHLIFLHRPLFPYNGNIKQLLRLNRDAKFSLRSNLYNSLSAHQYNFLAYTLAKTPQKRPNSRFLLFNFFEDSKPSQKSSRLSSSKITPINPTQMGVSIKTQKHTSIKKHNISMDMKNTQKKDVSEEKERPSSAKKLLRSLLNSFSSSSSKDKLKIKQNSVQKHKKMLDFVDC